MLCSSVPPIVDGDDATDDVDGDFVAVAGDLVDAADGGAADVDGDSRDNDANDCYCWP